MTAVGALWKRAAAWRWITSLAFIATVLAIYLEVTPRYHPADPATRSATYTAPRTGVPSSGGSAAGRTISVPPPSDSEGRSAVSGPAGIAAASSPGSSVAPGGSVTFVKSQMEGEVSGGGLIASYCCAGASSTVSVSRAVGAGKHYYELQLQTRRGETNPDTWTNAGIAKEGTGRPMPVARISGGTSFQVLGWGQRQRFRDGDLFMFALDLDGGGYYYGVNGQWINAVPGRDPGQPLERGAAYRPFVTISASSAHIDKDTDRWIGNFGQNPFRFAPPTGYMAYGSGPGAVATSAVPDSRAAGAPGGTLSRVPSSALMGKSFSDTVPLAGLRIPLPEGTWTVVAFQRAGPQRPEGEVAILANIESKKLTGLVAISAYQDPGKRGTGFPQSTFCSRTDYIVKEGGSNEPFGKQECWWINHAAQAWSGPVMNAARGDLDIRGVAVPQTMLNVGFRLADSNKYATVFIYFDPREDGVQSREATWADSDWHRDRISASPEKVKYVKKLESFGRSWIQILRANF